MRVFILILLFGCSQQRLAKKELIKKGYSNITFFDYKECMCSNGDIYYTGFKSDSVSGVIWRKYKFKRIYGISIDRQTLKHLCSPPAEASTSVMCPAVTQMQC